MRLDSCRECVRRRIRCDASTPECAKCLKKGIKCSGIGKQYRFVGATARGKLKNLPQVEVFVPSGDSCSNSSNSTPTDTVQCLDLTTSWQPLLNELEWVSPEHDYRGVGKDALPSFGVGLELSQLNAITGRRMGDDIDFYTGSNPSFLTDARPPTPLRHLETLDHKVRMLFDHFSTTVAPAMVVIDQGFNGYRDIILPLATQDSLVQRTVSVVAALHLATERPDLLRPAEIGRSAIIARLRKDALSGQHNKIFNLSTWVTIILLLVGETVTGTQEFVMLFAMLKSLVQHSGLLVDTSPAACQFLLQQSQMFNLFTPPFLDSAHGTVALQERLDNYFGFMSYPAPVGSELWNALAILRQAIYQARDLYLQETRNELSAADRIRSVESLRLLLVDINEDTPGMHAFVWVYFLAGAASSEPRHREFFSHRLKLVYNRTRMRNILVTLDTLEQIWCLPEGQNWTHCPAILGRVLVM